MQMSRRRSIDFLSLFQNKNNFYYLILFGASDVHLSLFSRQSLITPWLNICVYYMYINLWSYLRLHYVKQKEN